MHRVHSFNLKLYKQDLNLFGSQEQENHHNWNKGIRVQLKRKYSINP